MLIFCELVLFDFAAVFLENVKLSMPAIFPGVAGFYGDVGELIP